MCATNVRTADLPSVLSRSIRGQVDRIALTAERSDYGRQRDAISPFESRDRGAFRSQGKGEPIPSNWAREGRDVSARGRRTEAAPTTRVHQHW